jgi:CMP-N,N'-diacetyllegionaminic acid synthase
VIGQRRVLAVIPARGGSKGLPGKNILQAGGKPLLAYSVEAGHLSKYIDRVIVSSDDDAIMNAARACGGDVPFRRPVALANDSATTVDVILHALNELPGFDVVIVLQPTSPLRTSEDIDEACRIFERSDAPSCISVSLVEQSPYWMYTLGDNDRLRPLIAEGTQATRRQDLPAVYTANGAVYIADTGWLRERRTFVGDGTVAYLMPQSRSVDIDTAEDFVLFERSLRAPGD